MPWDEAWLSDYQARRTQPVRPVEAAPSIPAMPISIRLELPLPPSVNALYANVPGKGRVKTKAYREWIRAAWYVSLPAHPYARIEGSFTAEVAIFQPKGGDLDGRLKALFDFCKTIGAIKDDKYLVSLKVDLFPGEPKVLLRLMERDIRSFGGAA